MGYVRRTNCVVDNLYTVMNIPNMVYARDILDKQLGDGMTWANYGSYWHIDHMYPIKEVGLPIQERLTRLIVYNLAPLPKDVNNKKSNHMIFDQPYDEFLRDRKLMLEGQRHHCTSFIIRDKVAEFFNRKIDKP